LAPEMGTGFDRGGEYAAVQALQSKKQIH
jgi:hypothetical protein